MGPDQILPIGRIERTDTLSIGPHYRKLYSGINLFLPDGTPMTTENISTVALAAQAELDERMDKWADTHLAKPIPEAPKTAYEQFKPKTQPVNPHQDAALTAPAQTRQGSLTPILPGRDPDRERVLEWKPWSNRQGFSISGVHYPELEDFLRKGNHGNENHYRSEDGNDYWALAPRAGDGYGPWVIMKKKRGS